MNILLLIMMSDLLVKVMFRRMVRLSMMGRLLWKLCVWIVFVWKMSEG